MAGASSSGWRRRAAWYGLLVAAGCGFAGSVRAQQLDNYLPSNLAGYDVMPGVTVTSRLRPDYDPLGIRLGNTVVRPEASQSIGYDDNVLGTSNKRGSLVVDTRAAVQAAMASSRDTMDLGLDVEHEAYPDLPAQSYTNWSAGGGWSHDIGRDTIAIGLKHFSLNQVPVGIDSIGLARPLPYDTDTARLSYKAQRGSWTFVPMADFTSTRFSNSSDSGMTAQQVDSLNRNVESASLMMLYEFAPQRSAVMVVRGTTAQYTSGEPRPDYHDVAVLAGLDYNLTGPLRFRALAGYEIRDYDNAAFENHSSPIAEATLIWTPTGLTTVTAGLLRRIEDANEAIHTGYTYTQFRLVVDHEYLRNVLLQGRASITNASYLQSNDQQTLYNAGASVTYLLNRNIQLSATYDFSVSHQSGSVANDYTRSVFLLQLKFAI